MNSEPNLEDEASVAGSFEKEIGTEEDSLISFWLSGPIEEPSNNGQSASNEELVVMLPKNKSKKLTHLYKGK